VTQTLPLAERIAEGKRVIPRDVLHRKAVGVLPLHRAIAKALGREAAWVESHDRFEFALRDLVPASQERTTNLNAVPRLLVIIR
jgi:hypothetical protein